MKWYYNEPQNAASPPVSYSPRLVALFDKYKDPEQPDVILIDGTLAYLEDLKFDPEDAISLTLAYVLKSPLTGEFHRKDFLSVWTSLKATLVADMRNHILSKHQNFQTSLKDFEPFYRYVYDFVRGSDTRVKAIGYEEAIMYWKLLFGINPEFLAISERLDQWYTFIGEREKNISKDAWNMFFRFVIEVVLPDPALSKYDEMSAWPSVVDEYVEWLEESGKK